jgi:hypothetical protein
VPAPLQVLVGCALAAGIVPVHVTCIVWPAFAGTATASVGGVDASDLSAATIAAETTTATTAAPLAARRLDNRTIDPPL